MKEVNGLSPLLANVLIFKILSVHSSYIAFNSICFVLKIACVLDVREY